MYDVSPVPTPIVVGRQITAYQGEPLNNATLYRSAIGGLQYLTNTRPDICFAIKKLSQFFSAPTLHWQVVKMLFRDLKGTIDMDLHLKASSSLSLNAFTDAYWGVYRDNRRSLAAFYVFLGQSLISWS